MDAVVISTSNPLAVVDFLDQDYRQTVATQFSQVAGALTRPAGIELESAIWEVVILPSACRPLRRTICKNIN